ANFPACDFTSWDKPLAEPCPECGGLLVQPRPGRTKCTKCTYTLGGPAATRDKPVVAKAAKQPRQLAPAGRT
ncbi:MAG: hypothetical protein AAB289_06710, partial [Chloroflexota bacterium]